MELVHGKVTVKQFQCRFFCKREAFLPCSRIRAFPDRPIMPSGSASLSACASMTVSAALAGSFFNPVCQYIRQLFCFLVIVQLIPIIYNQVSFHQGKTRPSHVLDGVRWMPHIPFRIILLQGNFLCLQVHRNVKKFWHTAVPAVFLR